MGSIGKGINYFSLFAFSLTIALHSNSNVKCKKPSISKLNNDSFSSKHKRFKQHTYTLAA